ncbi:MAG TPA: cell division protein FtsZ [Alphaproteobacteria bacterium]|nr:cell division protein FtsZ [Alphaproteobacteria bacterium]
MPIQLTVPEAQNQLRPRITVFGVGGAGGNAVNNMIRASLEGVDFVAANTDAQSLTGNLAERKLQLGSHLTRGLGAGAKPEVGRAAAEEQIDEIMAALEGSNMAFITAGMGGGTGTGAAPVVARAAREQGILTVGVVTKPFHFEGSHRMRMAEAGIAELQQYVDTLIIIPNQNLFRIANERTTFADAFRLADEVLHSGVRGVTDLMVMPGLINLDFADIRSVMSEMGKAMMGTGEASGEKRSVTAAEAAIANPLLDDVSMKGARGVLINITGGYDMTLFEVDEAANRIREEVDPEANIIFGSTFDEKMEGKMRVSVVATGIDAASEQPRGYSQQSMERPAPPIRLVETKPASTAARPAPAFSPGFVAPAAAQASAAKPPAPPAQQQAPSAAAARAGLENLSPGWGITGAGRSPQPEPASQSAALTDLLNRARDGSAPEPQPEQAEAPAPHAAEFAPEEQEKQPPRRAGSLFARLAGFAQGSHRSAPAEQAPPAPAPQQPRLGIDPADRPQAPSEEEKLEIPAFLRRQSN